MLGNYFEKDQKLRDYDLAVRLVEEQTIFFLLMFLERKYFV
jgi:hypothetical protein